MDPLLNDPLKLHRRHAAAHLEAERLRREAIADLWRGADALLATNATQALRAAERLRQRLARRAASRSPSPPAHSSAVPGSGMGARLVV